MSKERFASLSKMNEVFAWRCFCSRFMLSCVASSMLEVISMRNVNIETDKDDDRTWEKLHSKKKSKHLIDVLFVVFIFFSFCSCYQIVMQRQTRNQGKTGKLLIFRSEKNLWAFSWNYMRASGWNYHTKAVDCECLYHLTSCIAE